MSSASSVYTKRTCLTPVPDLDAVDHVAGLQLVHHLHPADNSAERGVRAVEGGGRLLGDEDLAAAGVAARERHPHGAAAIGLAIQLAAQRVARPAAAVAARAACLGHEPRHDAVERQAVEEAAPRE